MNCVEHVLSVESNSDAIKCPCVRNCCLDENDVCLGCYRTLEEILSWTKLTKQQKREVLSRCDERRKARGRRLF
ncbi:DUF1289 domain-containing protein [Vibrio atypicus]|uniref:DUF1289 domain-containing protein n=1 Tax=Vibrio atypicus TaxID=558271 RepID=UPI00280B12DF|nr:DUF1289 domain-containing protein [Vibrio atypicus]